METENSQNPPEQPNEEVESFFLTFFHKSKTGSHGNNKKYQQTRFNKILKKIPSTNFWMLITTVVIATVAGLHYRTFQNFTQKNNRAYLSIGEIVFDPFPFIVKTDSGYDTVKTLRVKYVVKNSGNTPALNVSDATYFEFLQRYPKIVTKTDTSSIYFYNLGDNIS